MLADYLKLLGWWLGRPPAPALPPRLERTLHGILRGHSEKQIARELAVSPHTVHSYMKDLHHRLGVTSRGELLARFLPQGLARRAQPPDPAQRAAAPGWTETTCTSNVSVAFGGMTGGKPRSP